MQKREERGDRGEKKRETGAERGPTHREDTIGGQSRRKEKKKREHQETQHTVNDKKRQRVRREKSIIRKSSCTPDAAI